MHGQLKVVTMSRSGLARRNGPHGICGQGAPQSGQSAQCTAELGKVYATLPKSWLWGSMEAYQMDLIANTELAEMVTLGVVRFIRKLSYVQEDPAHSELVVVSYPVARAALDAGLGISLGWTLAGSHYLALRLDRSNLPHDILPFAPHDAPIFNSSDFFNSPFVLTDAAGLKQKAVGSLTKFQRFASAVLREALVESVEFRILAWGEYDPGMKKIECAVAGFMDAVEPVIRDVTDIPSTQVIVRR